jgi:hypothetical protein
MLNAENVVKLFNYKQMFDIHTLLMILSVDQNIQPLIIWWKVNNKLEKMWKVADLVQLELSQYMMEETE